MDTMSITSDDEFLDAIQDPPDSILELFDVCDINGNGYIERHELAEVCGSDLDDEELQRIFLALDQDADGRISVVDFTAGFQSVSETFVSIGKGLQDRASNNNTPTGASAAATDPTGGLFGDFVARIGADWSLLSCQEQISDLYQQLHASDVPQLMNQFENVICDVIKDINQQQTEIDRLEKSLRRSNEVHTEHLKQLEEEMEVQTTKTEQRVRTEEREKNEVEKGELKTNLQAEITQLQANLNKFQSFEKKWLGREKKDDVLLGLRKQLDELTSDNRTLKSHLTEAQTNLALARSELVAVKAEYDDQLGYMDNETTPIQEFIQEQQNLNRQVQLLQEANRKLQDTNDELRAQVDYARKSKSRSVTPTKRQQMVDYMDEVTAEANALDRDYRRRKASYSSQLSKDSDLSVMSGMSRRQFVYHQTNLDGDYPDDADSAISYPSYLRDECGYQDSGHSTLRDPLELDSELEAHGIILDDYHSVKRPREEATPPVQERLVTQLSSESLHSHHQSAFKPTTSHGFHAKPEVPYHISPLPSNPVLTETKQREQLFHRNSSPRSSGGSIGSRKRTLPKVSNQDPVSDPVSTISDPVSSMSKYIGGLLGFEELPFESNRSQNAPERMYKIVLAGDAAVGKSSFIMRLCKGVFQQNLNSTLGVDFQMKTVEVDGQMTSLQLWDTAGQERFRSIAKSYFRRADGVLLLYDCTYERSFINVRDWIEAIEDGAQKTIPVMLCGNKVDMRASASAEGIRCVRTEDGERLAKSFNALFCETSSKDGCNVEEAVTKLARLLQAEEDLEVEQSTLKLGEQAKKKPEPSRCCDF